MILIDESHKERTWTGEFEPFKQALASWGEVEIRKDKPLDATALHGIELLVIGGPEAPWVFGRGADLWGDAEVEAVRAFVAGGGGLLVIGDALSSAQNLSKLTSAMGIEFSGEAVRKATVRRESMLDQALTEGVGEIALGSLQGGGGLGIAVHEPAVIMAEHKGIPVLAASEYQGGRVVAFSSLPAFSRKYLPQADNAVLLQNILRYLSGKPEAEKGNREGVGEEQEDSRLEPEEPSQSGPPEESYEVWHRGAAALVDLWEEMADQLDSYSEELKETEDATFPSDRELLLRAWERDINAWQPRFIEFLEREMELWGEMKRAPEIAEGVFGLLHAVQVNRSLATSHRVQHVEILKKQLGAMQALDKETVDALLSEDLQVGRASALLRNDYARLLAALAEIGLPIPEKHLPQVEEIREEDYEVGKYLVEELVPVPMPGMGGGPDPWRSEFEEWYEARDRADEAREALERYSNTAEWYLQIMNEVRFQDTGI